MTNKTVNWSNWSQAGNTRNSQTKGPNLLSFAALLSIKDRRYKYRHRHRHRDGHKKRTKHGVPAKDEKTLLLVTFFAVIQIGRISSVDRSAEVDKDKARAKAMGVAALEPQQKIRTLVVLRFPWYALPLLYAVSHKSFPHDKKSHCLLATEPTNPA